MKRINTTANLTTAWTEIEPNWDINYFAVIPSTGTIEVAYYDNSGWSTEEEVATSAVYSEYIDCSKIRVRAAAGTASIKYSLLGRFVHIKEKAEKETLHDDDLVPIVDSEDSDKRKHTKKSNLEVAETDPVFTASPAYGIDAQDIIDWDEAHGWGDHSDAGYLAAKDDYTVTRTSGLVSSVTVGAITYTITRGSNNAITSITDGTNTWTYTRNGNNIITAKTRS